MSEIDAMVAEVAAAADWSSRVARIRQIPELFGKAAHRDVYARVAEQVYVPNRSSSLAARSSSVPECSSSAPARSSSPPERSTWPAERSAGAEYRHYRSHKDVLEAGVEKSIASFGEWFSKGTP